MYLYNIRKEDIQGKQSGKTTWVGSVADIRTWIDESRNCERFWITTILLSMLSVGVIILGITLGK